MTTAATPDPILVTGATGKTGREVAALLGERARPVSRSSAIRFDWHDETTWAPAVDGTSVVYLVRPDIEDAAERVAAFLDATAFEHVVLLSEIGAGAAAEGTSEARVERAVTDRAAAWTILRPTWFQQILTDPAFFLDAIRAGQLPLPSSGAPLSWVDARDIAAVAVAALTDPAAHAGRAHDITGPAAVSVADVAARLSTALGREVRAVDPPVEDAVAGYEPWLADVLRRVYARVADGTAGTLAPDVEQITGRPPRTLDAFIAEHRAAWAP